MPPITIILATANPHKVDELRAILASVPASAALVGAEIRVLGLGDLPNPDRFREPDETGTTFAENARIKALGYAGQMDVGSRDHGILGSRAEPDSTIPRSIVPTVFCLADDSGIEIDALALPDGTPRPGVISSHYFNDNRPTTLSRAERDAANNARVLRELEGLSPERRTARFVCCMCLVRVAGHASPVAGPDKVDARSDSALGPRHSALSRSVLVETRGTFEGRIGVPPRVPAGEHGFGYDPLFLVAPEFVRTGAELSVEEKNRLSHRAKAACLLVQKLMADPALAMH